MKRTMKEKIVRKMRKKEKKKWSIQREVKEKDVLALRMIPVTKEIIKIKE